MLGCAEGHGKRLVVGCMPQACSGPGRGAYFSSNVTNMLFVMGCAFGMIGKVAVYYCSYHMHFLEYFFPFAPVLWSVTTMRRCVVR